MSLTAEQVLDAALALPDEDRLEVDRLEVAEALFASLHASEGPPFDEAWREVIRRRSAELRSGTVIGVPWEQVKRRARERAGG